MSDPKRWLEEAPFSGGFAERLIVAGKRLEPPPEVVERSWTEFSTALAAGQGSAAVSSAAEGTATGGATKGALSTLTGTALGKSFLIGALLGTAVAGTVPVVRYVSHEPRTPDRPGLATTQPSAPANGTAVSALATLQALAKPSLARGPSPEAAVPSRPSRMPSPPSPNSMATAPMTAAALAAPPSASPAASSPPLSPEPTPPDAAAVPSATPDANQLKAEALLLARASRLLDAGDAAGALSLLSLTSTRSNALVQEHDALLVEALMRTGNTTRGREAARRFLRVYPEGPLADRVRRSSETE